MTSRCVTLLVACFGAVLCVSAAMVDSEKEVVDVSAFGATTEVRIPDLTVLRADASTRWPSFIKRENRLVLFREIERLSAEHIRVLSNHAVRVVSGRSAEQVWQGLLPDAKIPGGDGAVVVGILMQVDLLDAVLAKRDPGRAEALRVSRRHRSVRKNAGRVFGDRRDQVYHLCLDTVSDLVALQAALGVWQKQEGILLWEDTIRNQTEAEQCLLKWLSRLVEGAKAMR